MAIDKELDTLFPEVDPVKTAASVTAFFRFRLKRFELMSDYHLRNTLRSPVVDGMPRSQSFSNGIEDAIVSEMAEKHVESACKIVRSVAMAITKCSVHSQRILIGRFILHQSDVHIYNDVLNCDRSEYYRKRQAALNEFADAFQAQRTYYDLHVYEKNETNVRQNRDETATELPK